MITLFKDFFVLLKEDDSSTKVALCLTSLVASLYFFIGIDFLVDQSLFHDFPVASNVLMVLNIPLWFFFIKTTATFQKEESKYFSFLMGSISGLAFEVLVFGIPCLPGMPTSSHSSGSLVTIAIVANILFIIISFSWNLDPKETATIEPVQSSFKHIVEIERKEAVIELKTYEGILNDNIRSEFVKMRYLLSHINKQVLSTEEQHILSRSIQQVSEAMDEYITLTPSNQEKMKSTVMIILKNAEEEIHLIMHRKEEIKMNKIERIRNVQEQQKTTY